VLAWAGNTFVDFDHSLNKAVNRLREALHDSAEQPRYVQTIARRGYRLIVPVEPPESPTAKTPALEHEVVTAPSTSTPKSPVSSEALISRLRGRYVAAIFWGAIILFFAGLIVLRWHEWHVGRVSGGEVQSLAVLPLENLSRDPSQDYFADGMTTP
jgi:Transcriptional regulatory protein, C terminal